MRSADCGPGFNDEVMKALGQARLKDPKGAMTDVVMIIDEIALRQQPVYNHSKNKVEGHINYGNPDVEISLDTPLASAALVCMISGLQGGWKCPVGYIFTNKATAEVQKSFTDKAFFLLNREGFEVHALTADGCTTNVALFESYGVKDKPVIANQPLRLEDIVYSFPNPADSTKIVHAVYDVVHMMKLWRNLLAECGKIKLRNGEFISWEFVDALYKLQAQEGIRAGNKLGKKHIFYKLHKMKVNLAVQPLSSSVADAIEFCGQLNLPQFVGSSATIKFIRRLDQVFDILNSRSPAQKGQKGALWLSNLDEREEDLAFFCEDVLEMVYTEKRSRQDKEGKVIVVSKDRPLWEGARKSAAVGLIVSIRSIMAVARKLLTRTQNPLKFVLTYRFSQDLIELFFNLVRSRLGPNNNPNTVQFQHIMKQCWHMNWLRSTSTGNCVVQMSDELLPAGLLPLLPPKPAKKEDLVLKNTIDLAGFREQKYSDFYKNCLAYISGNVVRVVGTATKCETCAEILLDNELDPLNPEISKLVKLKDRGGLFYPCNSVFKVIELADMFYRRLLADSKGLLNIPLIDKHISRMVVEKITEKNIFPHFGAHVIEFDPQNGKSHLILLVEALVSHFLKIRLFDHTKRFEELEAVSKRQFRNKLTLFEGR